MTTPNIDTFEHDITNEIKHKEASIGDIASAGGDIGNDSNKNKTISPITILIVSLFVVILAGVAVYFGYYYYNRKINPPENKNIIVAPEINDTSMLKDLSPLFVDAIGRFVTGVEKTNYGYAIKINSYSSVFSYMLKNEELFAEDIAFSVGVKNDTSATTSPFIFKDITINNQNIRLGNSASSTVAYAFIGSSALIISSTTEGLLLLRSDILRR